jgi:glycosyltransferase involved in cell wall biosynthesis
MLRRRGGCDIRGIVLVVEVGSVRFAARRRVLMLTTSYPQHPGDASGPFVHRLAARLVAAGAEVTVLAPASPRSEPREEDGVDVHFFRYGPRAWQRVAHGDGVVHNLTARPGRGVLLPAFGVSFAAAARALARDVDVVHAHWLPSALVARAARRPRVVTVHGSDLALGTRVPPLVRAAVHGGPVLAVTDDLGSRLRAIAPSADVRVVPPQGADVEPQPFGLADPLRVLFVGRLVPEKGIDTLAAAWPAVRAAVPGATLEVVGDGPLRPLLRDVGPGVELRGALPTDRVAARYGHAAVVVMPSRRDAFATVALEAMARGRAVVCTPVGELATRVRHGQEGLQVPVGDAPALASAVVGLLSRPAEAARLGAAAAARVGALYGWDAVVARTSEAYDVAVAQSGRTARTPSAVR